MKYRKLRIAWSVGCGVLCALLIVLWVRSHSRRDVVEQVQPTSVRAFTSMRGQLEFSDKDTTHLSIWPRVARNWTLNNYPARTYLPTQNIPNFDFYRSPLRLSIIVPHWLPVFVTGGFAFVPWVSLSRRFSLRTLLIGMTVVALGLGMAVMMLRGS